MSTDRVTLFQETLQRSNPWFHELRPDHVVRAAPREQHGLAE